MSLSPSPAPGRRSALCEEKADDLHQTFLHLPMVGSLPACCARAASGHAAAPPRSVTWAVARLRAAITGVLLAMITSGCAATSSAAWRAIRSASPSPSGNRSGHFARRPTPSSASAPEGDFDRSFDWWRKDPGEHWCVEPHLPFESGRTDLLTGSGSRWDIQNINLLATLLVHAQYQGYWSELGMQFQQEIELLLERHLLSGLIEAPWLRTNDPKSDDDDRFFAALQELMAYAFEESVRIKKKGRLFPRWHKTPVRSSRGILQEVQSLLQK